MQGGAALQENFGSMVNHILSFVPDCPPQLAKRRLNTTLRQVCDRHEWAGLLVRGEMYIPASYSTGTVTTIAGSDLVTGVGTAWPFNDLVNTTLSAAITIAGEYQDVTPTSMTGIGIGDWLLVGSGTATEEYMLVISVGALSFKAKPLYVHAAGATMTKSSLMRRQFRLGVTRPFYNIVGVKTGQILKLDLPWSHPNASGSAYQIAKIYIEFDQGLRLVWAMINSSQGWRIKLNLPQEALNSYDSWRTTQGWAYSLADYIPDEVGRARFELYPSTSMEQGFPYLAYKSIPNMENDEDTAPMCIPSHMLVHGALSTIVMSNRKSPYYDPALAAAFAAQYESDLQYAIIADQNIYDNALMWCYSKYPYSQQGAAWAQSHDAF
jgi:hypothetical protein